MRCCVPSGQQYSGSYSRLDPFVCLASQAAPACYISHAAAAACNRIDALFSQCSVLCLPVGMLWMHSSVCCYKLLVW
jgi:hypothetical protein